MLNTLKKYLKFKKPFYGINCGTYGFLMNKHVTKNLEKIPSLSRDGELLNKFVTMKKNNDLKNKAFVSKILEYLKVVNQKRNIIFNTLLKKI